MNKFIVSVLMFMSVISVQGCSPAQTASNNIAVAAENFEINRRVVFINGITGEYILTVEGFCSMDVQTEQRQLEVTCKTGRDQYKKHHLGLSDNVTYFSEQVDSANVDPYHYRVMFRPTTLVPSVELDTPSSK